MPAHLTLEARLDVLRAFDTERKWYSLDDKRVCAICDRIFTGRQINIHRDQRRRFVLNCPTQDCPSDQRHWFFVHANPWPPVVASGNGHSTAEDRFHGHLTNLGSVSTVGAKNKIGASSNYASPR